MYAYQNKRQIQLKTEFYQILSAKLHHKSFKVTSNKNTSRWPNFFTAMETRDVLNWLYRCLCWWLHFWWNYTHVKLTLAKYTTIEIYIKYLIENYSNFYYPLRTRSSSIVKLSDIIQHSLKIFLDQKSYWPYMWWLGEVE